MPESLRHWDDEAVVAGLRALAADIDWPEPPVEVATAVVVRLRAGERPRRLPARRLRWAVVVLAVMIIAAVVAGIPSSRHAVADWLGIGAVKVTLSATTSLSIPPGHGLSLGQQVTQAQARSVVDFKLHDPPAALGSPDAVFLSHPPASGQIAYVYRSRPGLPPTTDPSVAVLITQFRAHLETGFFQKVLDSSTTLRSVTVNGVEGFWIEGHPHAFFYSDGSDINHIEDVRLAGNTLLWERDGITFRLESGLSQDEAVRIAESIP